MLGEHVPMKAAALLERLAAVSALELRRFSTFFSQMTAQRHSVHVTLATEMAGEWFLAQVRVDEVQAPDG